MNKDENDVERLRLMFGREWFTASMVRLLGMNLARLKELADGGRLDASKHAYGPISFHVKDKSK
jgi:hypothetical protein